MVEEIVEEMVDVVDDVGDFCDVGDISCVDLREPSKKDYIVYLLYNSFNRFVYIGSTNNRVRRLRQHNGELVGGAKYTHSNKGCGEWRFYGYIENLEKRMALSIEKRIQIRARKMKAREPLQRRLDAIREILLDYNGEYLFTRLCP